MKIFVTDAATLAGAAIVEELSGRGHDVVAAGPARTGQTVPGATVKEVDTLDQQAMADAMQGCETMIVAVPLTQDMKKIGNAAVKAAAETGIQHIVSVSCAGASFDAHWRLGREYGFVDLIAEESGIPFTVLRPNVFMQEIVNDHETAIREQSLLSLPHGKAQVSFMDARDLGLCVHAVLEAMDEHAGKTYALTGPEPLSGTELAELLGNAADKPVRWEEQPEAAYSQALSKAGASDWVVEMLVSRARIIRRDMAWNATGAVKYLTGQPPRAFADLARENADRLR